MLFLYLCIGTYSIIIYAWFCAFLTYLLVLNIYIYTPGFVLFLLAYSYLVYIHVYAWFCTILTCVLVLSIYIRLVLCYSYLRIGTCIYTPGFVLFLLAYWYLVYIRLVLCYSYLRIGT